MPGTHGLVWLVAPQLPPEVTTPGRPLVARGIQVFGVGADSSLNLKTLVVDRPAALRVITAADGILTDVPSTPAAAPAAK